MLGGPLDTLPSLVPSREFCKTHCSVVLQAGDIAAPAAAGALETLCRTYWLPLYTYIRRHGHAPHDAEDLAQDFFASLLSRRDLAGVHPGKGKFRTYLLACLQHFLANDWHKR